MRMNPRDPRLLLLLLFISVAVVAGCQDAGKTSGGDESEALIDDPNTERVMVSVTGAT